MSDHCVHSHRTYYLLHFNYRAASRTVIFEMGPPIGGANNGALQQGGGGGGGDGQSEEGEEEGPHQGRTQGEAGGFNSLFEPSRCQAKQWIRAHCFPPGSFGSFGSTEEKAFSLRFDCCSF